MNYLTQPVVVYEFANVHGEIGLCATHAGNPPEWVGALGKVVDVRCQGVCRACTVEGRVMALLLRSETRSAGSSD